MLQAGGPITITLSDRVQLSQCFAREFSHAKVTLLLESRRDRYRTYELNKTNIAIILVEDYGPFSSICPALGKHRSV